MKNSLYFIKISQANQKLCHILCIIYGLGQTNSGHSLTTIGRHLECAIQTELVVEPDIPLIGRKQSCRFQYNSSYARKIQKSSRRLALYQGQRSRRAKNRIHPE